MREATLVLHLDGCRRDYVTPENAPFLHGLAARALAGGVEAPPGYAQRAAMLSGTFPDTADTFGTYRYDPAASPFRWVGRLGPARHLYQPRKLLFPFRLAVKQVSRWTSGRPDADPAWIPGPALPHFALADAPRETLFDLVRAQGRRCVELAQPASGNDDAVHSKLLAAIRAPDLGEGALFYAQLTALDEGARQKGPLLPEGHPPPPGQTDADRDLLRRQLREVDRKCREAHEALAARVDRVHLVVVGDHGMAPVVQKVNILALLRSSGLKAGRDHVLFLDSTMARLWFLTDRTEERVVELLRDLPYGRIVGELERRERRIPTDRRHGDLVFAADPGVLFWPDYFHVIERDVKGMHGYLDRSAEGPGLLLVDSPHVGAPRDVGVRDLVDVFPTLCALAGVDVPGTNEGRSLLEAPHAVQA